MNPPIRYPLTVFYDASSPACAREIAPLKALDAGGRLKLVDCAEPKAGIHARDSGGRWFTGIAALEAAYRAAWAPSVEKPPVLGAQVVDDAEA